MNLPNLESLLSDFASFLFEAKLSSISVKNYLSDLRHFIRFCQQEYPTVNVREVFQSISKYVKLYTENQKSIFTPTSSLNRRLASIRRFETFLRTRHNIFEIASDIEIDQKQSTYSSTVEALNKDLTTKKILDLFKSYLQKEKKTHSTVKNYLSDLYHFFGWIAKETPFTTRNLDLILSEAQLNAYLSYLKLIHTSVSVINRRTSSIKKLTHFCFLEKFIPTDPFERKSEVAQLAPLSWFRRHLPKATKPSNAPKSRLALIYDKYNALPFTPYLHLALLVLATTTMAFLAYNQIIKQANPSSAATVLTPPKRQLSFQGRLTDSTGTPITTSVNVVFKLWNNLTAGSQLYSSSTCSITPDQDGIFNTLIGNGTCGAEIGQSIFADNRDVFLEVTVGGDAAMTPRQAIATVGYALNSETLQGYPAANPATINTVPVFDNTGNLNIGITNPSLVSTSGTFNLKGQALSLTTAVSSGGDIVLQPDAIGSGQIQAIGGGTTKDTFRVTNTNLTDRALISGYVGNDTSTGDLLRLSSGSTETKKFAVGVLGQLFLNANSSSAAAQINQTSSGDLFTASASGVTKFLITNSGNVGIGTTNPGFKLDIIGGANLGTGNSFSIAGNSVLTANILGVGVTSSSLVQVGALSSGSIASGFGTISTTNSISTTSTLNIGVGSSFQVDANGDIVKIKGLTYNWPTSQTPGNFLQVGVGGSLTWTSVGAGTGDITSVGSMTSGDVFADATADDDWLGLGATAGRIEFDDQATDEVNILNANVGIGTTAPTFKLDVIGALNLGVGNSFSIGGTSVLTANVLGVGVTSSSLDSVDVLTSGSIATGFGSINIGNSITTTSVLSVGTGNSFQVNASGDINRIRGVGYTWPSSIPSNNYVLQAQTDGTLAWVAAASGSVTGTGTANYIPRWSSASALTNSILYDTGTNIGIGNTTPSEKFTIEKTSAGAVVNQLKLQNQSNTAGSGTGIVFDSSSASDRPKAGIFFENLGIGNARGNLYLATNNQNGTNVVSKADVRLTITNAGDVGIGTTAPSSLFSIGTGVTSPFQIDTSGNILRINNIATSFPSVQGAASSVLTNNGSGVLTWAAASGGTSYFDQQNGSLYPLNSTVDFFVGGQATASAKFAILNMNSGLPVVRTTGYLDAPGATLSASVATNVPLTVKGAASQTANLQVWQTSAAALLANITSTGSIGLIGDFATPAVHQTVDTDTGLFFDAASGTGISIDGVQNNKWTSNTQTIGSLVAGVGQSYLVQGTTATAINTVGSDIIYKGSAGLGNQNGGRIAWQTSVGTPSGAVTLDAQQAVTKGSAASYTVTHTVASQENRLLIVQLSIGTTAPVSTSVTYNGVAMTLANRSTRSTIMSQEVWYLVAPDTGTHDVVITPSATGTAKVGVQSWYNVRQDAPFGTIVSTGASSTGPATVTAAPPTANYTTLDFVSKQNTTEALTPDGTQTQTYLLSAASGSPGSMGSSSKVNGTAMSWTWPVATRQWLNVAIPVASSSESPNSFVERLAISPIEVIVNEPGNALTDFRVEGDTDPSLIFADASADKVGIGTTAPGSKLEVAGTFTVSGSNLTSLGGNLTVTGTAWTATPTISGLITATSGLTSNGVLTANNVFTLGIGTSTGSIDTSDWDISATGAMTGISGLTNDGAYTQTGVVANTFTGTTTFSNGTYSALFTGGNVGIGTTAPSYKLTISDGTVIGYNNPSTALGGFAIGTSTSHKLFLTTADTIRATIDASGNVGIGTSVPSALFSVGTGATSPFQINSSGNILRINNIATSFPSVQGGASSVLINNGSGTLSWVGIGGTGSVDFWTRSTISAVNYVNTSTYNDVVLLGIGIGNTAVDTNAILEVAGNVSPHYNDQVSLGKSGLAWQNIYVNGIMNDIGTLDIDVKNHRFVNGQWNIYSGGGSVLGIGTTNSNPSGHDLYVQNKTELFGNVGIGVTAATNKSLYTAGDVVIGLGGTGKLDAGTVDPPYTINGEKYATYLTSMIGVKEEVTGNIATTQFIDGIGYRTIIDLDQQPKGSDVWLFSKTTNIKENINRLSVLLTGEGQTKTWYEIDKQNKILAIYSSAPTTISYRLTAPRFDSNQWLNTRDEGSSGFVLNDTDNNQNNNRQFDSFASPNIVAQLDGTYKIIIGDKEVQEVSSFKNSLIANLKAGSAVIADLVTENFVVRQKLITPIADIDELKVNNATISGTLYAEKIKSPTLDKLDEQLNLLNDKYSTASAILADLQARYSSYQSLNTNNSTPSADPLTLSPLATVAASLPFDLPSDVLADSVFTQSLSSFDTDLYIQPTGDKPIHLLANLMTLYPDGKVVINGDLIITGTIFANNLDTKTATVSGSLALGKGELATDSGKLIALFNEYGELDRSVDASVSAKFGNVTTPELIIAADNSRNISTDSATVNSNASIGVSSIATGSAEIFIGNSKVTDSTLIYITPISDTSNQVLYVKSKQSGVGFTIAMPQPATSETFFNFWLVQTK